MVIIGPRGRIRPVTVNGGCQSQSCAGSGAWKCTAAPGISTTPLHVPEQMIEEGEAAQLPVVDDVEPDTLLHRDGLIDRAVLDPLEFLVADLPGGQRGARL